MPHRHSTLFEEVLVGMVGEEALDLLAELRIRDTNGLELRRALLRGAGKGLDQRMFDDCPTFGSHF